MIRPVTLRTQPAMGVVCLGGLVATLLLSALVLLAREVGWLDLPGLIGGVFTGDPIVAFGVGFGLFFFAGVLVFAAPIALLWEILPGRAMGLSGALLKGGIWGLGLWVLTGLLLPLFGALNALPDLSNPGFFALSLGVFAPVWLLAGLLSYGISLALISDMAQGIVPMDTFGWEGHRPGENQNEAVF